MKMHIVEILSVLDYNISIELINGWADDNSPHKTLDKGNSSVLLQKFQYTDWKVHRVRVTSENNLRIILE